MTDPIIDCIWPCIQDQQDRESLSLTCKWCFQNDGWSRNHLKISFCYAIKPERLCKRFWNIESLTIKRMPRSAEFNLIPENWGGSVQSWVGVIVNLKRLQSLELRRMRVTDDDITTIASRIGGRLTSLKLDWCHGFSTDSLFNISISCRKLKTLVVENNNLDEKSGEWFHQLALYNRVLETLNLHDTNFSLIHLEDLKILARNCPLKSIKLNFIKIEDLDNLFTSITGLQEFSGRPYIKIVNSYNMDTNYVNIRFPNNLTSLGLTNLRATKLPSITPFVQSLQKLYFLDETFCHDLIRQCHSLEVLQTTKVIGDEGLMIVAQNCKRLKRLRIEKGNNNGIISDRGLIALATGCQELQYLCVYATSITNETLVCIGNNMRHLNDFRLSVHNKVLNGPLDSGIRVLLQNCEKMRRFALVVRPGDVMDVGLSYIGQLGQNLKSIILGGVGESDRGLIELCRSCRGLQKLEILDCPFTEHGLIVAATQCVYLKYLWALRYRASIEGIEKIQGLVPPYWKVEFICNGQLVPAHMLVYHSHLDSRTDRPDTVYFPGETSITRPGTTQGGMRRSSTTRMYSKC